MCLRKSSTPSFHFDWTTVYDASCMNRICRSDRQRCLYNAGGTEAGGDGGGGRRRPSRRQGGQCHFGLGKSRRRGHQVPTLYPSRLTLTLCTPLGGTRVSPSLWGLGRDTLSLYEEREGRRGFQSLWWKSSLFLTGNIKSTVRWDMCEDRGEGRMGAWFMFVSELLSFVPR